MERFDPSEYDTEVVTPSARRSALSRQVGSPSDAKTQALCANTLEKAIAFCAVQIEAGGEDALDAVSALASAANALSRLMDTLYRCGDVVITTNLDKEELDALTKTMQYIDEGQSSSEKLFRFMERVEAQDMRDYFITREIWAKMVRELASGRQVDRKAYNVISDAVKQTRPIRQKLTELVEWAG